VVVADLGAALLPPAWPAAVARFPATEQGVRLRMETLGVAAELRAVLPAPVAAAAAYALAEPEDVTEYVTAANRLHAQVGAAAFKAVTAAGGLCRPPEAGFQMYADLEQLRTGLDAPGLEAWLSQRLRRRVPGGHRFGDDATAPRVRIDVGPLCGEGEQERSAALRAADPLALPHVAAALGELGAALSALSGG
jgi:hypothetical protein